MGQMIDLKSLAANIYAAKNKVSDQVVKEDLKIFQRILEDEPNQDLSVEVDLDMSQDFDGLIRQILDQRDAILETLPHYSEILKERMLILEDAQPAQEKLPETTDDIALETVPAEVVDHDFVSSEGQPDIVEIEDETQISEGEHVPAMQEVSPQEVGRDYQAAQMRMNMLLQQLRTADGAKWELLVELGQQQNALVAQKHDQVLANIGQSTERVLAEINETRKLSGAIFDALERVGNAMFEEMEATRREQRELHGKIDMLCNFANAFLKVPEIAAVSRPFDSSKLEPITSRRLQ